MPSAYLSGIALIYANLRRMNGTPMKKHDEKETKHLWKVFPTLIHATPPFNTHRHTDTRWIQNFATIYPVSITIFICYGCLWIIENLYRIKGLVIHQFSWGLHSAHRPHASHRWEKQYLLRRFSVWLRPMTMSVILAYILVTKYQFFTFLFEFVYSQTTSCGGLRSVHRPHFYSVYTGSKLLIQRWNQSLCFYHIFCCSGRKYNEEKLYFWINFSWPLR